MNNSKQVLKYLEGIKSDIAALESKLETETNEVNISEIVKGLERLQAKRKRYQDELFGDLEKMKAEISAEPSSCECTCSYKKIGDKISDGDKEGIIKGVYYKIAVLGKDGNETKQVRYVECE